MKTHSGKRHAVTITLLVSLFAMIANASVADSLSTQKAVQELDSILKTVNVGQERADLLLAKGYVLKDLKRPMQAKLVFEEVVDMKLLESQSVKAKALFEIAEIHFHLDDPDAALTYNLKASQIYKSAGDLVELANVKIQKAGFIKSKGIYLEALKLYDEAIQLFWDEELHDAHANTQFLKGILEFQFENFDEAELLISSALHFFKKNGDRQREFEAMNVLLDVYQTTGKNSKAIEIAGESYDSFSSDNSYGEAARLNERISTFYRNEQNYRSAIEVQKNVIALRKEHKLDGQIPSMLILGELYEEALQATEAEMIYSDALEIAHRTNDINQEQKVSLKLSKFYESVDNPIKAFKYLKVSDSLLTAQLDLLTVELEHETNRQYLHEAELIKAQGVEKQNFEEAKDELWVKSILGIAIVSLVFLLLLLYGFFQMKKQSKLFEWKVYKRTRQLRKVNGELNTFIYKSSHDLRTPLTNIKSLLRLLNKEEHNAASNKYLNLINSSTEQMDNILINLSEAVDYKKVDVKIKKIDFSQIKYDVDNKEISIGNAVNVNWNIVEKAPFFSDEKFIKVILQKTIANAQNYRSGSDEDFCNITIITDRNGADVSIEDNGVGIADKVKDNVFEMFVKGSNKSKGAGLGLYLVKIATDKIKGKISLESTEKKGSKLLFHLPNLN